MTVVGGTAGGDAPLHGWQVTPEEAIAIQQRLRERVRQSDGFDPERIRTIAGVDAAYKEIGRAAVVLLSYPELAVIEEANAVQESVFPYVPGLLSFRELPMVLAALERLRTAPDLIMVDGQGIAHPRRFGIAAHLGVYLDVPTIGCAKSRLTGRYDEPGPAVGDRTPLTHRGETIGAVVRSKPRSNPLFISVGHRVSLETAVAIVLRCLRGYRLPEPTRLADRLSRTALPPTQSPAPSLGPLFDLPG